MHGSVRVGIRRRIAILIATAVVAGAIALPASATAAPGDDPTSSQYDSTLTQLTSGGDPSPPTGTIPTAGGDGSIATASSTGTSLPFTGLDLALMLVVAAGLGVAGVAMKRASRREEIGR